MFQGKLCFEKKKKKKRDFYGNKWARTDQILWNSILKWDTDAIIYLSLVFFSPG